MSPQMTLLQLSCMHIVQGQPLLDGGGIGGMAVRQQHPQAGPHLWCRKPRHHQVLHAAALHRHIAAVYASLCLVILQMEALTCEVQ